MADRPEMFAPNRWFSGMADCNGTIQNVVGPTLVAMATKFGLKSPITPLVWQIGRICFGLLGDFRGWPIQCNHAKSCTADLVAMTTTFALGV